MELAVWADWLSDDESLPAVVKPFNVKAIITIRENKHAVQ